MVYDEARHMSVYWPGSNTTNQLWAWDGVSWTTLHPSDPTGINAPAPRTTPGLAYDSNRQVVILFGGHGAGSEDLYGDTWEWDGTQWTLVDAGDPLGVTAPKPRNFVEMVYDSQRQMALLFGGKIDPQGSAGAVGDTWEWNGVQWASRSTSGPPPRVMHAMAYDSPNGVTLLLGGTDGTTLFDDFWQWDGNVWSQINVPRPPSRRGARMTFDALHQVIVLFGGDDIPQGNNGIRHNDVWYWDGSSWQLVVPSEPIDGRLSPGFAYDTIRQRIVMQGGSFSGDVLPNDTWELVDPDIVPTVSEWGLVVMSLLVLTAGTLVYARRRPGRA